jgi:5-methylcytosine-specific restriction endonuclease McrA
MAHIGKPTNKWLGGEELMKFELKTLEEYSDESCISELRRVAESLQGQRLTRDKFDKIARVHSTTLSNRFGSWAAALDRAGIGEEIAPRPKVVSRDAVLQAIRAFIEENPGESVTEKTIANRLGFYRGAITRQFGKWENILAEIGLEPVPLGRRYTDEECFENILTLWTHYGRQPHYSELKQPPSEVGPKAYVLRWGGWRAALSAFVKQVNEPYASTNEQYEIESKSACQIDSKLEILPPRTIPLAMRYKILSRDKFRCVACGASPAKDVKVELHVDHIHPWSRGGKNIEENLRTLCSKCNLGKGAKIEDSQPNGCSRETG